MNNDCPPPLEVRSEAILSRNAEGPRQESPILSPRAAKLSALGHGAIELARAGAAVFPCKPRGKEPLVEGGFKAATRDEAQIRQWWTRWPSANIGVATGRASGLIVVDVDGEEGEASLAEMVAARGALPATAESKTGRGRHLYFVYPADEEHVQSCARRGLDIRADDAYAVAPPSVHANGARYSWVSEIAELSEPPDWIAEYARSGGDLSTREADRGKRVGKSNKMPAQTKIPPVYSASEDERIRRALEYVPADGYDPWVAVGMALHSTGWGDKAFRIFDDWSKTSEKYDAAESAKKWESFSRADDSERTLRTLGTLFHLASQHGYVAQHPSVHGEAAWTVSVSGEANPEDELNQRERLICIGLEADLWQYATQDTYATIEVAGHRESHPLRSIAFSRWLRLEYGRRYPKRVGGGVCPSAVGKQAVGEAIDVLDAKASIGPTRQAAVRVAGHGDSIFIDLGSPTWDAVEISSGGWRIAERVPVRFIRPPGFSPLPPPVRGGDIRELRQFVNVADTADFVLIFAWLLAAFRPSGPYPALILNGEQGAAKSTVCRVLRRLVDPNAAEIRSAPKNEEDLFLAAKNGHMVALDNLSYVKSDLSDAICRIATGAAYVTRTLYTNGEEFMVQVCRPVLLNGIPTLASKADLVDRSIVLVLPAIEASERKAETDFWADFDKAAPRILGCLFDGVAGALRLVDSVSLRSQPRMLDFARWGEAACQAFGGTPGLFEEVYKQNRTAAGDVALEADAFAATVLALVADDGRFEGTASDLLRKLESLGPTIQRDRHWPQDATRLSGRLRRAAPLLRERGVSIDLDTRSSDKVRRRLIRIRKLA
jgi:hypothetical protein